MIVKEDQRVPFSQFDLCYTVRATNPNFKEAKYWSHAIIFFDFQNSFSIDSHLLNRVIYFLVTGVIPTTNGVRNTCQAWSENKSTINIQNKNIYRYRSLTGLHTAIRGFKHLLSSLFASTFASRAVSSTDNKLQQSDNLDFKTLPFLTIQLVPIPRPPTAQ